MRLTHCDDDVEITVHRQTGQLDLRLVVISVLMSLLVVACAGSSTRDRTAEAVAPAVGDEAFVKEVVDEVDVEDGTFLFAVIDADGLATSASKGTDAFGVSPSVDTVYRIASFTKVFTALATLTLVDEGLVDLDAPADEYVSRLVIHDEVTVRDLLQHTSGIRNVTESVSFVEAALADESHRWTPEEIHTHVAGLPPLFAPASDFRYSNTNYLILGVLIEEVTGRPYHRVIRDRIIDPLAMSSTYLEGFEDGPLPFAPYKPDGVTDFDGTSIATAAWSTGAMVSSLPDLHVLFEALFNGKIISEDLVAQMTQAVEVRLGVSGHGVGFDLLHSRDGFYGHPGGNPGYMVRAYHAPELGITAFLAATDARLLAPPAFDPVLVQARSTVMTAAIEDLIPS